jgi:hypothetical protein
MVDGCGAAVQADVGCRIVRENIKSGSLAACYARFALLRAGLRRKEGFFCFFTARLKPCPDTCMAGGYGTAV